MCISQSQIFWVTIFPKAKEVLNSDILDLNNATFKFLRKDYSGDYISVNT